jgi:hypothetical protein
MEPRGREAAEPDRVGGRATSEVRAPALLAGATVGYICQLSSIRM